MVYTMTNCQLRGTSPTVGGPDLIDVSIPFVVKYDGTNAPLKVEVTETKRRPPGSRCPAVTHRSASRVSASSAGT
jgi:hypothetical protein